MKKPMICLLLLVCVNGLFTTVSAASMTYQEIVDLAYTLYHGEVLPDTYRLYGKIIKVDTPYSYEYNNVTVTIVIQGREDMPIQCYRLTGPGCTELKVGDSITVEGKLKNYKDTIEFDTGCIWVSSANEVPSGMQVNIQASFDKIKAILGEPITLRVKISGCSENFVARLDRRLYDRRSQ